MTISAISAPGMSSMERVPLRERVGADLRAARQELREPGTGEGRRAVQVDTDHGCPVRRLVPGQQVAGEAHQHPHDEDEGTRDPEQLARVLVGAEQEHARHVHEEEDHEDARPQRCMPRTSQPSVRSFVMCSIDVYAIGLPVVTSISDDGL